MNSVKVNLDCYTLTARNERENMPAESLDTDANTRKRRRPSYKDQFPPLDEFEDVNVSDGGVDDEQPSTTEGARTKADDQQIGTNRGDHASPRRNEVRLSGECGFGGAAVNTAGRTRKKGRGRGSKIVVLNVGRQNQQTSPTGVGEDRVTTHSGSDKENTRCNRCILIRRRCDNVRPVCGNCVKSRKTCVYERASVTRAELERMAGRAGESGTEGAVMRDGGVRRRREVRGRGVANPAKVLFEGFTDEEEEWQGELLELQKVTRKTKWWGERGEDVAPEVVVRGSSGFSSRSRQRSCNN